MTPKTKALNSMLLTATFAVTVISGFMIRGGGITRDIHKISSYILIILVIIHIVGYFPLIRAQMKQFFTKKEL